MLNETLNKSKAKETNGFLKKVEKIGNTLPIQL